MELHPHLLRDCHRLGRLPECELLLHRNALIPWLILVPETVQTDLLALPSEQRNSVMEEVVLAGQVINDFFSREKLNFAAIGNVVSQLHLHVIGRHAGDSCWPKPVWGNLTESSEYSTDEVDAAREAVYREAEARGIRFLRYSDE